MTTTLDTQPLVELDTDTAAVITQLHRLAAAAEEIDGEIRALKAILRERLTVGQAGTVRGEKVVTLSPNRRFDPALALQLVPSDILPSISSTSIDSKLARAVLPPALMDACMREVGELKVVLT